ncbi:MAG: HEAT repeat domain-containing protein [Vicinamibacterales bacterium]
MPEPSPTTLLTPDAAAKLADFARACKAAARAVSLYPGAHPAITASLARLVQLTAALTSGGPYRLQVSADKLLVAGAGMPKPDSGVSELAELLHRHLIGAITLNAAVDADSWRTLLLLLARSPEDVRAGGGIRHLWTTAGGPSIELEEIDYAEVLREKQGVAAAVEQIVAAALAGRRLDLDDSGMRLLRDIVEDPAKLQALMEQLQAATERHGTTMEAAAFLNLLRGLTEWLTRNDPQQLEPMFTQMGEAAGRLSAEAMLSLLDQRQRPEAMIGATNVAGAVVERMDDEALAHFVAGAVIKEGGATARLAHAFQALVPDVDRQRRLLALAAEEASASDVGGDGFAELWSRVEGMLTSYSDETFVSEDYARELSGARTRPVDVERTSDDPPERIAGWLGTVSDTAVRGLDHQLLIDLLRIEQEPLRWRDIAETVTTHAEDLVRVSHSDTAWQLAEAVVVEAETDPARRPHAAAALARFTRGAMMKDVSAHLRGADDAAYDRFKTLCYGIGAGVIPSLAEVLSSEQDARSRRRLRDILVGFGPKGRESVRQLMNAPNWEVRRTAAYLLREFGGAEGVKELVPLLTDNEPLVQREAVQALVTNGSDEASRTLLQAMSAATGRTRDTLLAELTASMRDERAAPLFSYLVRHLNRRKEPQLYLSSLDAIGTFGGADAVEALKQALHEGDWRTPFQTRKLRTAAASALRRIGTPEALQILRDASTRGPRGVRSAARSQLAQLG